MSDRRALMGAVSGASGSVQFASGTYTPSDTVASFSFDVDFEPSHVLVITNPYDLEQTNAWKEFLIYANRDDSFATGMITRYLNNAVGSNTAGLNQTSIGTYADGRFTVNRVGAYGFPAGVTYTWFCWRDLT